MEEMKCDCIGKLQGGKWDKMHDISKRVYSIEALAPTIHTCGGGNIDTSKILSIDTYNQLANEERVQTIRANINTRNEDFVCDEYRIRKLTPKECWRLMGFDDEDYVKAKAAGLSDSQLYKQAGNSIVVNVLEEIFKQILGG